MKRALLLTLVLMSVCVAAAQGTTNLGAPPAPEERGADADCGTVKAEGFPFDVHVTKGNVPCPRAQEVARRDLGQRSCGSGKLPACVADGFHCREATFRLQDKTGIGLFCYTLKRQLPPSKDHSPYRLSLFTRAITVYVGSEE